MKKFAFIIKTNSFNEFKAFVFKTWMDNLTEEYDAFIMFDRTYCKNASAMISNLVQSKIIDREHIIEYDEKSFCDKGFPVITKEDLIKTKEGKTISTWYGGNTMLIYNMVYQEPFFFELYPSYERYFVIEDDILFNGDYSILLNAVANSNEDFIPVNLWVGAKDSQLFRYVRLQTEWINREELCKSFLQCCVYSRKALYEIHDFYANGNCIYHEYGFPTVIRNRGLKYVTFWNMGMGCVYIHFEEMEKILKDRGQLYAQGKLVHPIKNFEQYEKVFKS